MEDLEHIVASQRYVLELEEEKGAFELQSRLSLLQDTQVSALIERILDQFEDPNSIYQFNAVELDLGVIPRSNFDQELIYRIEERLMQFLSANILPNGDLRTGKRIKLQDQRLQQFVHFLKRGYFDRESNQAWSAKNLLYSLVNDKTEDLRSVLMELGRQESVRKRLILHFDEPPLERIVSVVAPAESEYIIEYKRQMLSTQQKAHPVDTSYSSYRNAVWEIILAYLFQSSKSYYNRKNFLHFFIRKIAERYTLSYRLLLDQLAHAVKAQTNVPDQQEFKALVLELQSDELQREPSQQAMKTMDEESALEWLKQMSSFLERKSSSPTLSAISNAEFNLQFSIILRDYPKVARTYLGQWMNVEHIRFRLLMLVSTKVKQQILELFKVPFTRDSQGFMRSIQNLLPDLSPEFQSLWVKVEAKEAQLILQAYSGKSHATPQNVFAILEHLQAEFKDASVFLQELNALADKVSSSYRRGIQQFLKKYGPSTNATTADLDQDYWYGIQAKIESYGASEDSKKIHAWLRQQSKSWAKDKKLDLDVFLEQMFVQLGSKFQQHRINDVLEDLYFQSLKGISPSAAMSNQLEDPKVNASEKTESSRAFLSWVWKQIQQTASDHLIQSQWNSDTLSLLSEIAQSYKLSLQELTQNLIQFGEHERIQEVKSLQSLQSSTHFKNYIDHLQAESDHKFSKDQVLFVIAKGTKPWWLIHYGLDQFNREFSSLLTGNEKTKKELLKAVLTQSENNSLFELLSVENQTLLWKALSKDKSSSKLFWSDASSGLVPKWFEFIASKLIPTGWVNESDLKQLKQDLFILLLSKRKPSATSLLEVLENWILEAFKRGKSSSLVQLRNLPELMGLSLLQEHPKLAQKVNSWLEEHAPELIAEQPDWVIPESLDKLLHVYFKEARFREINGDQIQQRLIEIIERDPETFSKWLAHDKFRKLLLSELNLKSIQLVAAYAIPQTQQHALDQSLKLIAALSPLTQQEFQELRTHFYQLLFFRMSLGSLNQWEAKDWSRLLAFVLKQALRKKKGLEVLAELQSQLIKTEASSTLLLKLVNTTLDLIAKDEPELHYKRNEHAAKEPLEEKTTEEEKPYRKLGEEEAKELLNPIFIPNAGLILLAPFLGMLFEKCELTQGGVFKSDEHKYKAAMLLHYAANNEADSEDPGLIIEKVLCGIPITFPVDRNVEITEEDKETVNSLLYTVTQQWTPLKNTSVEGLRNSFIQRDARIEEEEEKFYMIVEKKAFDMLLDQIPWNISKIKLSWMLKILEVEWR